MSGLLLIAPLFIEDGQFSSTLVLVSGTQLKTYADVTVRTCRKHRDGSELRRRTLALRLH
jgi:hypothetical protein